MTAQSTDEGRSIAAEAESRREELVSLSAALVAAPSVNPPGDTRSVAAVVAGFLSDRGIDCRLEADVSTMPSVLATVDSGRPGPVLVLNVHLDTMPPGDESAWSVPPFELTRTAGRLYGLGMGNMKGAVAAMCHALDLLASRREQWCGRIEFAAVSDEVVFGDHGAAHLLATLPALRGDAMICGEGAGFRRLALGEKGVLWLELRAGGEAGHSSSVRPGRSASARIAKAVVAIDALTGLRGSLDPAVEIADVESGLELSANVGTIAAGSFIGQVAVEATAEVDLRVPPGLSLDDVETLVRETIERAGPGDGVTVRRIKGWEANLTPPASAIVTAWHHASDSLGIERPPHAIRLPASDASRWRRLGIPAICYGPQPTFSAGIDDYAEEDEVVACAALYTATALDFLSPALTAPDAGE